MSSENEKVARAAGIVGAATLASRIMGYIRDMVMSWAFGTGQAADAFYVAYRIPNLLRELLAEGSMSAAFIPVFTETLARESRESARRLANAVFARLLLILLVLTVAGVVFAPFVVKFIAWGFKDDPGKFAATVSLTRIMFPYLLFIGLAALAMGMLNSLRTFLAPALSPVMLNIMTISAIVLSIRFLPDPIYGVAFGVVLGGLFQFLIQTPSLARQGMMIRPEFSPGHPAVARVGRLALPIIVSSSVTQINIFVSTILASFLATGSITYLFYGMRFIHFPLGIFGIAIATAILPTMSSQAARNDRDAFRETLSMGIRLVFFIMFPAMAGIMVLAVPIISLLLEHGRFDASSTAGTATALSFYAVGLWAFAGVRIVAQAFYSLQDTATPVKVAAIAMVSNILLSLALMKPLAHGGLALATSLSAMINLALLTVFLRKKIGRMDGKRILASLAKILPVSALMAGIGWWISLSAVWSSPGLYLHKGTLLLAGIAASVIFYLVAMGLLKSEELAFLRNVMARKVGKKTGTGN